MTTATPPAAPCDTKLPAFLPAHETMLLIDYFAARAMQAYFTTALRENPSRLAEASYQMAQHMINIRESYVGRKPMTPNQQLLEHLPKSNPSAAQGKK